MASSYDTEYFKSYGSLGVHELMIKDRPRTEAYKEFLEKNTDVVKDKVVLDVGAGTGILSLFAARSGARKVYAVEASDIADVCREIVAKNKYENIISVLKSRVEDVVLEEKVDVIISEWMGFYLLHESMLDSVLFARDKWLKPEGVLLPSHASIYASPVNMSGFCSDTFEFWEDVYGFDFSPFQERTVAAHLSQPTVICLKEGQLLSEPQILARFELKTMKLHELQDVEVKLPFNVTKQSVLHGFAAWFDINFTPDMLNDVVENEKCDNSKTEVCNGDSSIKKDNKVNKICHPVTLDTSPFSEATHWKQTVCFLPVTMSVEENEIIFCKISLSQDDANKRHYNISLEMRENLDDSDDGEEYSNSDDDLEEDTSRHPIPCDCGSGRCRIIQAIMEKYDAEQTELEMEAEFVDVSAEVQAAQTLDNEASIHDDSEVSHTDDSSVKENCL